MLGEPGVRRSHRGNFQPWQAYWLHDGQAWHRESCADSVPRRCGGHVIGTGGNGTLAWEPSPGVVAYVGWSGAGMSAKAVTALRTLAEGTYVLTPRQWLAAKPQLDDQENNPAK